MSTMHHIFSLLLWLHITLRPTNASPIHSISNRQVDVDCYNQGSVFVSECWHLLGLSAYLDEPEKGWNQTTPVCSDSSRCCLINEPWSTCYLRLGRGLAGADCTTVNDQTCTWDNAVSPHLHPSIVAQVRYVMKSIYGVHDFFSSYFKGKTSDAPAMLMWRH